MTDIKTQIETDALTHKRLKTGQMESEKRPIKELIEADQYVSAQNANTSSNRRGLIITKLRPPGSS
jgi:hypothetical protein